MPELKRLIPVSDWVEFKVRGREDIDSHALRFKLAPVDLTEIQDVVRERGDVEFDGDGKPIQRPPLKFSAMARGLLVSSIQDWDLTESGEKIPLTDAEKKRVVHQIAGLLLEPGEGGDEGHLLGTALLNYAGDIGNYLKN